MLAAGHLEKDNPWRLEILGLKVILSNAVVPLIDYLPQRLFRVSRILLAKELMPGHVQTTRALEI